MKLLKIIKGENEVLELSVAYGLFYLLQIQKDPVIKSKLINKSAAYLIEIYDENIEYEDLTYIPLTLENTNNINSSVNKVELLSKLKKINSFFEEENNIENIFKYFETFDNKFLTKNLLKKATTTSIGTHNYGMGMRKHSSKRADPLKLPMYLSYLSFLGFVKASNYFSIDKIFEVNCLLIPKEIEDFITPEYITYKDKETGEIKNLRMVSKKAPKIISLAKLYLLSLKKLSEASMMGNYDGLLTIQYTPAGNKPLNNKKNKLLIRNLSLETIKDLIMKLDSSNNFKLKNQSKNQNNSKTFILDIDSKLALADYLLTQNYESFSYMVRVFTKKDIFVEKNKMEEIVDLQIDKYKEIHKNQSVKKLGQGLWKIADSKSYSIKADLIGCKNITSFSNIMRDISTAYKKETGYSVLEDTEYKEIIDLIDGEKTVKMIADAILIYSSLYIEMKKKIA